MKKVLLISIELIIVFGVTVTSFCQDLTKDLQVNIKADRGVYYIYRGGYINEIYIGDLNVGVKIELKNSGNSELKISDISEGTFQFKFKPSVSIDSPPTSEQLISKRDATPFVTLRPQETISNTAVVNIRTNDPREYRISGRYILDESNYIDSNTICIKIIKTSEIIINSDKKVYKQDEDISIGGIIRNISGEELLLHLAPNWLPRFEISSDNLVFPLRSNPVKLRIIGGKINYEKPYFKFAPYEDKRIRTGNLYNLKWYFWDVYGEKPPSPFGSNGRLKPGLYTIRLVDFSYIHKGDTGVCEIESNPIIIEVIEKK